MLKVIGRVSCGLGDEDQRLGDEDQLLRTSDCSLWHQRREGLEWEEERG